jgi:copper transport protein
LSQLPRFSAIAATSVTLLLATGAANAVTQIPDWSSLVDTAYGRALLVKLGIMAILLAVAAGNAFYLRPRIEEAAYEGDPADALRRRMSFAVRVELLLGLAVLFAAAILVLYPTSRVVRDAQAFEKSNTSAVVGYEEIQPAGDLAIDFTASPNSAGQNSFRVFLFSQAGTDIGEVLKVRLKLNYRAEELGVTTIDMESAGPFAYKAAGPYLSKAGEWDIDITVQRRGVDDVTASYPVPVAEPGAGGGQFVYPFTVGSWLTVAAAIALVMGLLAAIWISDWPGLPDIVWRLLRVGIATLSMLALGIVALSLIPGNAENGGNPIKATTESISIGQRLYTQNCQTCHGQNGGGDGPQAASLKVRPADFRVHIPYHQDQFFFRVMSDGLGTIMPSFGNLLTEEERWNLLNYLKSEFGPDAQLSSPQ